MANKITIVRTLHTYLRGMWPRFLLICCCSGSVAFASENLIDIYQLALANDADFKAAEAEFLSEKQLIPLAVSGFLPSIGFAAQQNWFYFQPRGSLDIPDEGFSNNELLLNLSQPLFDFAIFVGAKTARDSVSRANANYVAAAQSLIMQVAEAYFIILEAEDNLEYARAERESSTRQLHQVRRQYNVDMAAISDLRSAQANYDLTVAQELVAENDLADQYDALSQITGQWRQPKLASMPEEVPLLKPEPADANSWVERAEKGNLQLQAAYYGNLISKAQIGLKRAERLPTVDFVGTYSRTSGEMIFSSDIQASVPIDQNIAAMGIHLDMTVMEGGSIIAEVKQAQYNYQQSLNQYESLRRSVSSDTLQAYRGVLANISQVQAYRQAVISNESALAAMQSEYRVGTADIVDVLNTQTSLYSAKRSYSAAKYNYMLSMLQLKQSAGMLSMSDLEIINQWLQ